MDKFDKNWHQIKKFFSKPVFCFTMDIDWAEEEIIEQSLQIFREYNIPVTPFITHKSKTIKKWFDKPNIRRCVGLHPNFLPNSTHGKTYKEQISYIIKLWPQAKCFRSHSFFDHYHITQEFFKNGFLYDANLCSFLQKDALPIKHSSGLIRFPTTWEDDHHFDHNLSFNLKTIKDFILSPGLKIFNFHPIHIALNSKDRDNWNRYKKAKNKKSYKEFLHTGKGTKTFLFEILNHINNKNINCCYLNDLYKITSLKKIKKINFIPLNTYKNLSSKQKNKFIQKRWNNIDESNLYTTSRDINLKELEISFIKNHIKSGKILDIGCGNGYTLFCLAKKIKGDLQGIDFSKNSLKMAKILFKKFKKNIKCAPSFIQGDVRTLPFKNKEVDYVFSERCLLNLPSRKHQYQTIKEVHRILKKNGKYIMIEGTRNGLRNLNNLRKKVGLGQIKDRAKNNITSLKFEETILEKFLKKYFIIKKKKYFSNYYLISRVIHPLLVKPDSPKFDAKINYIGRVINEKFPEFLKDIGHVIGYVLEKK